MNQAEPHKRLPATLLDLLTGALDAGALAQTHGCTVTRLPPSGPAAAPQPATSQTGIRAGMRSLQRLLAGPLMMMLRTVLRRPQVRRLALSILKRSPTLYARAYRMMMATGGAAGAAAPAGGGNEVGTLSPRANALLRTLRKLGATPQTADNARPRLAFVSPLPPERTGVATYATELLSELSAHLEIELVVAQPDVALPAALAHLPVRSSAWFAEHGDEFDQVLYQMGNSPFHSHMFALLACHPGVVVLHDFFLGGALVHAQMSGSAPHAWLEALFQSHGYGALRQTATQSAGAQAHKDWPCSLPVLAGATRTIVHSLQARRLVEAWFGAESARCVDVIPHPRTPPASLERASARAALGIAPSCFLVCSFGFIAPHKLTHELLRAWIGSTLHGDRECVLVLVGANHDSPYGVEVEALIRGAGPGANIRIAGWTDAARYRQYLQAADVGVQLRTNAQGESSGAVLDSMNYGLPTIVNANGSMAEFPPDAVWRLPDTFAVAELTAALETLRADPARRAALGVRAVALLDAAFRPAECARRYLDTLARARAAKTAQHAAWRSQLAALAPGDEAALQRLATTLAQTEVPLRRQLLVDVSDWVSASHVPDALTARQLRELLAADGAGLRVEPVYLDSTADAPGGAPRYRQARNAVGRLLGLGWPHQDEPVVDLHPGDIYYAPDAASPSVARALDAGLLAAWRTRGVTVNLLVRAPGDVPAALRASADRLLCASDAVARQLAPIAQQPERL